MPVSTYCYSGASDSAYKDEPLPNPDTASAAGTSKYQQANEKNSYEVSRADLPLHCPMDGTSLWNSHPRVYIPIEDSGKSKCPYCGAVYILKD